MTPFMHVFTRANWVVTITVLFACLYLEEIHRLNSQLFECVCVCCSTRCPYFELVGDEQLTKQQSKVDETENRCVPYK